MFSGFFLPPQPHSKVGEKSAFDPVPQKRVALGLSFVFLCTRKMGRAKYSNLPIFRVASVSFFLLPNKYGEAPISALHSGLTHPVSQPLPAAILAATSFITRARPLDSFKMLKRGQSGQKASVRRLARGLEKLSNIAEIDAAGPVSSTPAPLSPLPTKLQHLSLGWA